MNNIGVEEVGIFSPQHDIYPLVDPDTHFTSQTYKDKVVIITGGSKGIGATTALFYAKAGANVVLVARNTQDLEERKAAIEKDVAGSRVVVISGDVTDLEVGQRAVQAAVKSWGRVDVVVASAGLEHGGAKKFHEKDPVTWWHTQEVNVRGTLNIVHSAIPELLKTKGQVIVLSSALAHRRLSILADYGISKHTINRFVEIMALDYSAIRFYTVHPGLILTPGSADVAERMGLPKGTIETPDSVELPAATFLWLTARNAEFLSGRYIQATWDLNEVLAKQEEIVRDNLLVTKLAGPTIST
ncbi:NAD(P)-binding protein [Peniophora sp. CONT]|nr:NAD(P)-binding protein [Peniophora sp. CONT]